MITSSLQFNSIKFEVTRIHRDKLDSIFTIAPPIPPTCRIQIWGGYEEDSYNYDDPSYLQQLRAYNSTVFNRERVLFYDAISYDKKSLVYDKELYALTGDMLACVLSEDQIAMLFSEILYLSTVTDRGIKLAYNMFNVKSHQDDVTQIKIPSSDVTYSHIYRDRLVAKDMGYTWLEFCELSGQQQSNEVAVSNLQNILAYLTEKKRNG